MQTTSMPIHHPFQCIQIVQQPPKSDSREDEWILFGAAGPRIFSFSPRHGNLLSEWPSEDDNEDLSDAPTEQAGRSAPEVDDGEPPEKKRKVSLPNEKSESSSAEFVLERPKGRRRRRPGEPELPTVAKMAVTGDRKTLVVVTVEDKCLRVLGIGLRGKLRQQSQRNMPKRPCSIGITPDDKTILCGDKFGDVYELPLHPSELSDQNPPQDAKETPKVFKPSASELTVHTKKNRMTLQNQLRTAQQAKEKPSLAFENKIILGHVSLLTDLKHVSLPADQSPSGKTRHYLLTADRDEHIRVSRGHPQSHITELYCQAHTEFVSRLCVPDWQRDLLVSGGGDSFLLVWRWPTGKLMQKVDLSQPVLEYLQGQRQDFHQPVDNGAHDGLSESDKKSSSREVTNIAVTGIWAMQYNIGEASGELIVVCEGIAALFCYHIAQTGEVSYRQTIQLDGNALDVAVEDVSQMAIVSTDHIHEANSTQVLRSNDSGKPKRALSAFFFNPSSQSVGWNPDLEAVKGFNTTYFDESNDAKTDSVVDSLYTMETLRKRVQGDGEVE